jgi:cation transport ATPase
VQLIGSLTRSDETAQMSSGSIVRPLLVATSATGLALGLAFQFLGKGIWAQWAWGVTTIPVLLALLVEIASSLRRGEVGLDIVAALSMAAALVFGQELAGMVVALMYSGGQYLESFAEATLVGR